MHPDFYLSDQRLIHCVRTACGRQQVDIKARTHLLKKRWRKKKKAKDNSGREKQKAWMQERKWQIYKTERSNAAEIKWMSSKYILSGSSILPDYISLLLQYYFMPNIFKYIFDSCWCIVVYFECFNGISSHLKYKFQFAVLFQCQGLPLSSCVNKSI